MAFLEFFSWHTLVILSLTSAGRIEVSVDFSLVEAFHAAEIDRPFFLWSTEETEKLYLRVRQHELASNDNKNVFLSFMLVPL